MNEDYHVNYFIEPIYARKHKGFSFRERRKLKKFIKKLKKTSPNFNMLLEIYHFIRILSDVYSYPNSEKNTDSILFTAEKYGSIKSDACFCVRRGSLCITYNLWLDNSWIEIVKSNDFRDSKSPATRFKFKDGESIIENIDQENILLNIITITMDAVSELVEYYWKNKFRGY